MKRNPQKLTLTRVGCYVIIGTVVATVFCCILMTGLGMMVEVMEVVGLLPTSTPTPAQTPTPALTPTVATDRQLDVGNFVFSVVSVERAGLLTDGQSELLPERGGWLLVTVISRNTSNEKKRLVIKDFKLQIDGEEVGLNYWATNTVSSQAGIEGTVASLLGLGFDAKQERKQILAFDVPRDAGTCYLRFWDGSKISLGQLDSIALTVPFPTATPSPSPAPPTPTGTPTPTPSCGGVRFGEYLGDDVDDLINPGGIFEHPVHQVVARFDCTGVSASQLSFEWYRNGEKHPTVTYLSEEYDASQLTYWDNAPGEYLITLWASGPFNDLAPGRYKLVIYAKGREVTSGTMIVK
jgi:hypothetical protein